MLLGVLLAQVYHWYTWASKERRFIKIIVVCSLGCLDPQQRIVVDLGGANVQYWVLIHSIASSIFVVAWVNHLFSEKYGKFSQFVDNGRKLSCPFVYSKADKG
jgi:hypothetical protein